MLARRDEAVETRAEAVYPRRLASANSLPALPLRPLIAEYTATFGSTWAPVTRRKHGDGGGVLRLL